MGRGLYCHRDKKDWIGHRPIGCEQTVLPDERTVDIGNNFCRHVASRDDSGVRGGADADKMRDACAYGC
jgi:hypothetical protein